MQLAGQGDVAITSDTARPELDDRGYIMVALLIGMAVAAVWMGALLPAWRQQAIREQEAELQFRGEQYARAILLYRAKFGNVCPPSVDALLSAKVLRKKYIDPITGKDFVPLRQQDGGICGFRSASSDQSIRVYNGQQSYSQWEYRDPVTKQLPTAGSPPRAGSPPARGGPTPPGGRPGGGQLPPGPGGVGPGGGPGRGPTAPPGGGRVGEVPPITPGQPPGRGR